VTRRLAFLFLLGVAACTEQTTAPGTCPNFCPNDSIAIRDTIFTTIIERDSSFRGYVPSYSAEAMTAADLPGIVDSRAFFTTDTMIRRVTPKVGDTTTVPIVVDSSRVRFVIVRRPKNTTNLRLRLYQIPVTTDSTSTFASLDPYFTATPVDSLNVTDLLARPAISDTQIVRLWGDSIRVDTLGHVLQISRVDSTIAVYFHLDTLQAPLSDADTGRLGWGVRVAADSFASIGLGTSESGGNTSLVRWFYHYTIPDTVSATPDSVVYADRVVAPRFDNFVFTPPTAPLDSNLAVGGTPSARALLRVAMPAFLHDSVDVVRATLVLVPVSAVPGVPSDSFTVQVRAVVTDLGAKSPLSPTLSGFTFIHPGSADTVNIELTNLVRSWSLDTTLATAFVIGQVPEAASYSEIRFYSSRAAAFRPGLHVTYVKRFRFGNP
jgi:hypothetical protein